MHWKRFLNEKSDTDLCQLHRRSFQKLQALEKGQMHITPPVTAEGYDGSHHPRCAEYSHRLTCHSAFR